MAKNKYPKPHQTTSPKHNEDYVFVEKQGEDFTGIKLISGPFASIVYKYGKVGFAPESEKVGEMLPMKFDYNIIKKKPLSSGFFYVNRLPSSSHSAMVILVD